MDTQSYVNKLVGFVVQTRRRDFIPLIGECYDSPGDDDCLIHVTHKHPRMASLDEAIAVLDAEKDRLHRIFREPVQSLSMGSMGHWLSPMLTAAATR